MAIKPTILEIEGSMAPTYITAHALKLAVYVKTPSILFSAGGHIVLPGSVTRLLRR